MQAASARMEAIASLLLQADEDGDQAATARQRGQRLADDGPEGERRLRDAHGVARRVRRRQEVADRDRAGIRIDLAVHLPDQCDGLAAGKIALLVEDDAGPEAAGAGDDAGHAPVIGHPAFGEPAGVIDDENGAGLDVIRIGNREVLRAVRTEEQNVAGAAVEVDADGSVAVQDPYIALIAVGADVEDGVVAVEMHDLPALAVADDDVAFVAVGPDVERGGRRVEVKDVAALAVADDDIAFIAVGADKERGITAVHMEDLAPVAVEHDDVALVAVGPDGEGGIVAVHVEDVAAAAVAQDDVAF